MLTIDHGYGPVTRYARCSKIMVVRGQHVKARPADRESRFDRLVHGAHLHYEVWVNGRPVDPMKYVLPDAIVD